MSTAGGEILALTNAALKSLNRSGMDFAPHEASSFSHSIFSPTGSNQATNVPMTDSGVMMTKSPTVKSTVGQDNHALSSAPSSKHSSLSPLTISARDIEGGSLDFTEFCNGSLNFSESDDFKIKTMHQTLGKQCVENPYMSVSQGQGSLVLVAPRGTSSPSVPVRMRVSARKLREIHSPLLSVSNRSASSVAESHVSDNSLLQAHGSTTKVQSSNPTENSKPRPQMSGASKAEVCPQVWNKNSLRQGIMLDRQGGDETLNSSGDSIVVSSHRAPSSSGLRQSRMKLVEETSRRKNVTGISGYSSVGPQQVQLVRVSTSKSAKRTKLAGEGDGGVGTLSDEQRRSQRADVMETAKLVATCTAAATAALLGSGGTDMKPSGDKVSSPTPPSATNHQHGPAKSFQTNLPVTKVQAQCSVTKDGISSHLKQAMDKYSHKESSDAHSGKQSTTTTTRAPRQPHKLQVYRDEKDGPETKTVAELGSALEEYKPSHPDSSKPMHHTGGQFSPRKGTGKAACLHPVEIATTEGLAKKRNCKRHSYHSAPTQNSETVTAALIDTKNDFDSKRMAKRRPLSPSGVAQRDIIVPTQLMDVLKRVQKLEDLQHVHNLELAKGSSRPTSLLTNGAHRSTSFPSRKTWDSDDRACPREQIMNKLSHSPLHTECPANERRFGVLRVTGSPHAHCYAPVEGENGDHKYSGAICTMKSPAFIQRTRKDSFSLHSSDNVAELDIPNKQACPKSGYSHHTTVHSKFSKAKNVDSESAINNKHTDVATGSPPPGTPDLSETSQGTDVLVHAQKVLGTVKSAKRDLEILGEFEESERTFGDLVEALGSTSDGECQVGVSWKVSEFLSSLSLSGAASAEIGKHHTHNNGAQAVAGEVGKQKNIRSKQVTFKEKSLQHTSIATCPHLTSIPNIVCGADKLSSSNYRPTSGYSNLSSRNMHTYTTFSKDHIQVDHRQDGLNNISDHTLQPQLLSLPRNKTTSQIPLEVTSELATAVPLGAPCIMPSPHYNEVDGPSIPIMPSPHYNEVDGPSIPIMPSPHYNEVNGPSIPIMPSPHYNEVDGPSIPIMPSPHYNEVDGPSIPIMPSPHYNEVDGKYSSTTTVPEVEQGHNIDQQIGTENSEVGLEEEKSVCSRTWPVPPHQQLENLITESNSTLSSELDEETIISISGLKAATPPPASQHTIPMREASSNTTEAKSVTSQELDKLLQEHLKTQATQWIERELIARMLSQMQYPLDPVPPHPQHHSTANSSSRTNSMTPLDTDAAPIVNEPIAVEVVKDIMKENISKLVQEIAHRTHSPPEESHHSGESGDDFNYTTPEFVTMTSSSTTSLEDITLLSTPQATPSHSPPQGHSPTPDHTPTAELQADLATPTVTPPLSFSDEAKESSVSTPQATEEDVSTSTEVDLRTKSIPSLSLRHDEVSTPSATPVSKAISFVSSQSHEASHHLMTDKSQQVTPIQEKQQTLSESLTTSSSFNGPTLSTSTSDREISAGEFLLQRPGVPLALATSLSEGEVPHSPGEAQWYAMYTARMNQAGLVGWNDKSKRKLDLTRVSVKSSPDPTSTDSSNLSEDPQKVYSIGEVRQTKRRPRGKSLDKFLSRLDVLSPENTSTPVVRDMNTTSDSVNTLSEMPSICHDELLTQAPTRHRRSVKHKIKVVPYQNYPLLRSERNGPARSVLGRLSPGEVPRHIHDFDVQQQNEAHSTQAAGEMKRKTTADVIDCRRSNYPETNSLRDGIDVINISRHDSDLEHKLEQESSLVGVDEALLVQPVPSTSRLQVIEVKSYEETETETAGDPLNKEAKDLTFDSEISDTFPSSQNMESMSKNIVVRSTPKPPTVVIPTAGVDRNHSIGEGHSVSENIDNSSDFDFSSISVPGF